MEALMILGVSVMMPFFPCTALAARPFTVETHVNGVVVSGKGEVETGEPGQVEILMEAPYKSRLAVKGAAAEFVLACLQDTERMEERGLPVTLLRKHPHTIQISLPHDARMILALTDTEPLPPISEGALFHAEYRDTRREEILPLVVHVTGTQTSVFAAPLVPIGWVDFKDGKPGAATSVIPDSPVKVTLQRVAEAVSNGMPAQYKGEGWSLKSGPL